MSVVDIAGRDLVVTNAMPYAQSKSNDNADICNRRKSGHRRANPGINTPLDKKPIGRFIVWIRPVNAIQIEIEIQGSHNIITG